MIYLENINREFTVGDQVVHALKDINLEIKAGEYLSIMGPSGSGKSTLLNLIGLLDQPTSGIYKLNDENVTDLSEQEQANVRNQQIGFIFQSFHLVPRLTAAENIELPLMLAGMEKAEREARVNEVLEKLHLTDRAEHRPQQLSGGQRQRVAIARATVTRPKVLLADEPTGNLDQKSGHSVIQTLEQLNDEGLLLIVVTHDLSLGERTRRRIELTDGEIILDKSQV